MEAFAGIPARFNAQCLRAMGQAGEADLYEQLIADALESRSAPSLEDYADLLRVTSQTIRRRFRELEDYGLLSRQGKRFRQFGVWVDYPSQATLAIWCGKLGLQGGEAGAATPELPAERTATDAPTVDDVASQTLSNSANGPLAPAEIARLATLERYSVRDFARHVNCGAPSHDTLTVYGGPGFELGIFGFRASIVKEAALLYPLKAIIRDIYTRTFKMLSHIDSGPAIAGPHGILTSDWEEEPAGPGNGQGNRGRPLDARGLDLRGMPVSPPGSQGRSQLEPHPRSAAPLPDASGGGELSDQGQLFAEMLPQLPKTPKSPPRSNPRRPPLTDDTRSVTVTPWYSDAELRADPWWARVEEAHAAWVAVQGTEFPLRGYEYAALRYALREEGLTPDQIEAGLQGARTDVFWRGVFAVPSAVWPKHAARFRTYAQAGVANAWPEEDQQF